MVLKSIIFAAVVLVPAALAQQNVYRRFDADVDKATKTRTMPKSTAGTEPTTPIAQPTVSSSTGGGVSVGSGGGGGGGGGGGEGGNPYAGASVFANPYYASEISTSAIPSLTGAMATKAAEVAKVPTYMWLDTASKVPVMGTFLEQIKALGGGVTGQFVVYDLPDRDCAAYASNGEYTIADNGIQNYYAYIDSIKALLVTYSDVKVVLVIEPDSLANLVTNLSVAKCANAEAAYKQCITYAIKTLNLPNVSMYLDAGHSGWLGWPANIGPAATLFASIWQGAGSPSQVRGLVTNVANYNAWTTNTCASYTAGDANCDEEKYINALSPLLNSAGFPAHFIVDTSRNGVQPTSQNAWGDWCNVINTGFGIRPSTDTGNSLVDAFVWVKPGGECDGTSNTSAPRYDAHCGLPDALQPSPQAGTWFQAYFVQLLTNANPAF